MWYRLMNDFRLKKSVTIAELLVATNLVVELSCMECNGQGVDSDGEIEN